MQAAPTLPSNAKDSPENRKRQVPSVLTFPTEGKEENGENSLPI